MAISDYRQCDVCGGKAFYDANLDYEEVDSPSDDMRRPYLIAGAPQYDHMGRDYGYALGRLGDWAILCHECSKTHRVEIVER